VFRPLYVELCFGTLAPSKDDWQKSLVLVDRLKEGVMKKLNFLTPKVETELINFAQNLVRIISVTGDEKQIIAFIEKKF
jgi:hypothetical protein